mmetsp:Transcript_89611/g.256745  ORF Transcript_89611/g.256745 Transcript_89611/m.256745 type:complete len:225 (-) Transcript_89611:365-1039(-)
MPSLGLPAMGSLPILERGRSTEPPAPAARPAPRACPGAAALAPGAPRQAPEASWSLEGSGPRPASAPAPTTGTTRPWLGSHASLGRRSAAPSRQTSKCVGPARQTPKTAAEWPRCYSPRTSSWPGVSWTAVSSRPRRAHRHFRSTPRPRRKPTPAPPARPRHRSSTFSTRTRRRSTSSARVATQEGAASPAPAPHSSTRRPPPTCAGPRRAGCATSGSPPSPSR